VTGFFRVGGGTHTLEYVTFFVVNYSVAFTVRVLAASVRVKELRGLDIFPCTRLQCSSMHQLENKITLVTSGQGEPSSL